MSVFNKHLIRMVRQTLHALKRQYGGRAVLCTLIDSDTNYRTGGKTRQFTTHSIARVIVLPSRMSRDVVESVARISSNKPLAYGGQFNVGDRGFIIDGQDLPSDHEIKKDDWIVYRSERYSINTITKVVGGVGWAIVARKHPGQKFSFDLQAETAINVADVVVDELDMGEQAGGNP
jgi:hypothetical protein